MLGQFPSLQKKGKSEMQQWRLVSEGKSETQQWRPVSIDAWAHLFLTIPNVVIYDGDVTVGN